AAARTGTDRCGLSTPDPWTYGSALAAGQPPDLFGVLGVTCDQVVTAALLIVGVIAAGRHGRAQKREVEARLHARALPDSRRHPALRALARGQVGAQEDLARLLAWRELEHPHWPAQVEMKDLFCRQPVQLGKGISRQQVIDRRTE